jgi:hypothetical protein
MDVLILNFLKAAVFKFIFSFVKFCTTHSGLLFSFLSVLSISFVKSGSLYTVNWSPVFNM